MSVAHGYLLLDDLKATLRITNDTFDVPLEVAIESASRQIDQFCDDQFWLSQVPTQRLFKAEQSRSLFVRSFATTAGLVVEVDLNDDGVFETTWVSGTDFQVAPVAPMDGFPFNRIETLGTAYFPGKASPYMGYAYGYSPGYYGPSFGGEWYPRSQRARVRVTAQWGWPAVPAQVVQACQILAVGHYKSKDLTNGQAGMSGLATGSFGSARNVMISPAIMDPIAQHLLNGLRDVVIA